MPKISEKSSLQELCLYFGMYNLTSSEESLISDEDLFLLLGLLNSQRYSIERTWKPVPQQLVWWDKILHDTDFNADVFKCHFRMDRICFWDLCKLLTDKENDKQEPLHLQLAVALYRFGMYGNGASSIQASSKFGVGEGSVHNFTNRVINLLLKLSPKFVRWPSASERKQIGNEMATKGLPKCVGFVDGTDIPFSTAPLDNKEVYWSRKKKYCMQAQIICDPSKKIIDLFTGYPGSVHDAKVYSYSPPGAHPDRFFSQGEFLIGDSAYPLSETLIAPFRRTRTGLTVSQKKFNRHISSQRVAVEHTIGMLKCRFQSLSELRITVSCAIGHKRVCEWIHACIVLHNYLIEHGDNWDDTMQVEEDAMQPNDDQNCEIEEGNRKGYLKREALFKIIMALQ